MLLPPTSCLDLSSRGWGTCSSIFGCECQHTATPGCDGKWGWDARESSTAMQVLALRRPIVVCALPLSPYIIKSSSYTLPARFLVPKQQFNPGTKTAPPDAGRALQPPRACAGCGRATTYTGQRQQLKMAAQGPPHTCCFAVSKPLQ
jgi:hypothetical protein